MIRVSVCMYVCYFAVRPSITSVICLLSFFQFSKITRPNFIKLPVFVIWLLLSPPLTEMRYVMYTSAYVDDVMFSFNAGNRPEKTDHCVFKQP